MKKFGERSGGFLLFIVGVLGAFLLEGGHISVILLPAPLFSILVGSLGLSYTRLGFTTTVNTLAGRNPAGWRDLHLSVLPCIHVTSLGMWILLFSRVTQGMESILGLLGQICLCYIYGIIVLALIPLGDTQSDSSRVWGYLSCVFGSALSISMVLFLAGFSR